MTAQPCIVDSGPVRESGRIHSLDLIRGVAVLGILLMNAVYFGLGSAPSFNLNAGGPETWLDWAIGVFGEVFIDQKFMGLFSMLFGAGMILFIDRAREKGRRAVLLNLWRNGLLLVVGFVHSIAWSGDILMIYAVSSLFLIGMRKLSSRTLISAGVVIFLSSAFCAVWAQQLANSGETLAGLWTPGESPEEGIIVVPWALGYFLRGLGLILVGAGLYRAGFISGESSPRTYRKAAIWGLVVGLPLAVVGVVIAAVNDYSSEIAFLSQVPNTLGTIPAALGYLSLIIIWSKVADNWLKIRLRATGRMALTNYLAQTAMGLIVFGSVLGGYDFVNRSVVLIFVVAVWAFQLWWSQAWLSRFLFGPMEWLWRVGTYRKLQPLIRSRVAGHA